MARAAAAPGPRTRDGTTPTTGHGVGAKTIAGLSTATLQPENNTLKETVVGLEREGDFYSSKFRDIELPIQQAYEEDIEIET